MTDVAIIVDDGDETKQVVSYLLKSGAGLSPIRVQLSPKGIHLTYLSGFTFGEKMQLIDPKITADIHIRTLHDPEGKHPNLDDYWLAWANGVQGDGLTELGAVANAKARLASGEEVDATTKPS